MCFAFSFVASFVDVIPDEVWAHIPPDMQSLCVRVNPQTGHTERLKALYYTVQKHAMTLKDAQAKLAVSAGACVCVYEAVAATCPRCCARARVCVLYTIPVWPTALLVGAVGDLPHR